ncbi:penicillin-binding protein 2 [Deltaproteobacteria bacterium TL4]
MTKTKNEAIPDFKFRLLSVVCVMGLCFVIILGRVYYLQIFNSKEITEIARSQHESTVTLEAQRGTIYDRKGRMLAVSVPVDSLYANARQISNARAVANQLAPLLSMKRQGLIAKLSSKRAFIWLKRLLKPEVVRQIKALKINGLGFLREYKRFYPNSYLAGPLLGFTGMNADGNKDTKGLEGLEYEYQDLLYGRKLIYIVEKDGTHRIIPNSDTRELKNPHSYALHLTIDTAIQYYTEKYLAQGVKKAKAQRGIAIVIHSKSGQILAMASSPSFNPNHFGRYDSSSWLNGAVTFGYEPGSSFKPITLAIALENHVIQTDQTFDCENGEFRIGDRIIHDTSAHKILTLEEIIQKSSNICAAKIGLKLPPKRFYQGILRFGFGSKTGVGLSAEATGRVLSPEKWTEVDQATISYGHGLLASPIQIISAINIFANGGIWVPPYVVSHVNNEKGESFNEVRYMNDQIVFKFGPQAQHRVIQAKTAETITQYMKTVTQSGGTAEKAALSGYQVAGKTGTSQVYDAKTGKYSRNKHIAIFAGFVPASEPELTILVLLEHPRTSSYGGVVAAPVFRKIAKRALLLREVFPESVKTALSSSQTGLPNGSPQSGSQDSR